MFRWERRCGIGNFMKSRWTTLGLILFLGTAVCLTGCRSYHQNVQSVHADFYRNDLARASEELTKQKGKKVNRKNEDLMKLEESMLQMCRGEFRQAESLLREVRDRFDHLENARLANATQKMISLLSDDTALPYSGEDYEKVMIRAMLAINSLLMDGEDARAYANQINLKQQEIIARSEIDPQTKEKVKKSYRNVALGPYLCAILNQTSMMDQTETLRELTKVCQWAPDFLPGKMMLEHAKTTPHSRPGNGVLHVFVMLGRGPRKIQVNEPATQLSLLIADQIVSATSKHSVPPTIAPVPIPAIEIQPCRYRHVDVFLGEKLTSRTVTLTDVNRMAKEQFEVNKPWIIARAAARRVVKKAGIYGIKESSGVHSTGELLLDLAGIAWELTEEADTRCWSLLPGEIQVARLELPAGTHDIGLQGITPSPADKTSLYRQTVTLEDGRNSYLFLYLADDGLIGKIQTQTP